MRFARLYLLALAATFAAYVLTLQAPFQFDDSHTIVSNGAIQSPRGLLEAWLSASAYSSTPDNWGYRPVTTFSNALAWLIGGGATWPFHALKLLLHALVSALLAKAWEKLWRRPGFFPLEADRIPSVAVALALVFAVHPANSQVVSYVAATSTLLAGAFLLGAYLCYLAFRENGRSSALILSLILYVFGGLSKEEGITLPAMILLTELIAYRSERTGHRRGWIALGAHALAGTALAVVLRLMFATSSSVARGSVRPWEYFVTQWRAYLRYMRLPFAPWGLNADNLAFGFSTSALEPRALAALFGNLAILVFCVRYRRKWPVLLFGLLWFYTAVSPASSFIPLAEPVNDHRMYIAYLGFLGAVFPWVWRWTRIAGARVQGAILALLLVACVARSYVWASSERLWIDTVEKNPTSGRALNNLALVYMERGDWKRTGELLDRCRSIEPTYANCRLNQAILMASTGRDAEARVAFVEGIALQPYNVGLSLHFAEFKMKRGNYSEALSLYREVDKRTGGWNLQARVGLEKALMALGRNQEAEAIRAGTGGR